MTVSATTVDTAQPLRSRPRQLGLPPMVWAVGSCHLVARAGGFVKPVLVLYLTQEQGLSASAAGAVLAADAGHLGRRGVAVAAVPDATSDAGYPRRAMLPALFSDRLMLIMALIYVGHFTLQGQAFATLPLLMSADGHSPAAYGTVLALSGIVIVVLQPVAVAVLSRRDRATVLATSMLMVGIGGGVAALAHSSAGYTMAVLIWTLGQIGIAVHFGAAFADLAPSDLRGRYMGVASSTWSLGAIFGPLAGTALLQHTNRTWLATASVLMGLALFAAQRAVAASLGEREAARPTVIRAAVTGAVRGGG